MEIRASDPRVMGERLVSVEEALLGATAVVCAVGHEAFARLDISHILQINPSIRIIFDLCGVWHKATAEVERAGVRYVFQVT